MYERYFEHFNKIVPLTEQEQEFITNYLTVKKLRKRQNLLRMMKVVAGLKSSFHNPLVPVKDKKLR